tara:strand:- start:620 stop:958 length:339 start_codon:yes stop_codon:yes gene_type:complete
MATRYNNRKISRNKNKLYKRYFEDRNVNHIRQFRSPDLAYPTTEQIRELQVLSHIWKTGDRYYKLAFEFYGNSKYWWVIAWFNKKPTEAHLKLGDVVFVPTPLDKLLNFYDV